MSRSSWPSTPSEPVSADDSPVHSPRGSLDSPPPVSPPPVRSADAPGQEQPLLDQRSTRPTSSAFVSSPLNPNVQLSPSRSTTLSASRSLSRPPSMLFNRIASEDAQALARSQRGSIILYRFADPPSPAPIPSNDLSDTLSPPQPSWRRQRDSYASTADSAVSLSSDSKYPMGSTRNLIPYVYDPASDDFDHKDLDDDLHDPALAPAERITLFSARGCLNLSLLLLLVFALLALFVAYPVLGFFRDNARNLAIDGNIHINGSGQVGVFFGMPELIDTQTPNSAKTRTGWDGQEYELVFSDEFNTDGRTFYPGDDPYWEAVDLWYWATNDLEWYDPVAVTTQGGFLQITMDSVADTTLNHGLQYRSGMLQSWNKFCFTTGYIEVSLSLPGPNSDTEGYWPGVWTMGNLGRPGYGATTDGMWPYSYDACDVGTFPNQTLKDQSGPAAALHSDNSKAQYDFKLSVLSGQRASACTCPGEDHPGPSNSAGRGAPEIDVLEAERNKLTGVGQVVSQSAQFAPFTHDYDYVNDTAAAWDIYNSTATRPNTYKGSAVQQALSALTVTPDDMFQGSGQVMTTFGFEYWSDPQNRDDGFITWMSDGSPSYRLGPSSVGPDQGESGSGVSQRLISEEPMSIVFNLGISHNWQTIDLTTMEFPAIMLVDYVRVYQRKGQTNIGCDPKGYPTADYIARHPDAYGNANFTGWTQTNVPNTAPAGYPWPKNSQYDGC